METEKTMPARNAASAQDGLMEAQLFGSLSLCWNSRMLVEHAARPGKPLELLAMLLVQRGRALSNAQLMDALWEEDEIENPAGALKNAVYSLRRQLAEAGGDAPFVLTENGSYRWNPQVRTELDLWQFEDAADVFEADGAEEAMRLAAGRTALRIYGGDVLPGLGARRWVMLYNSMLQQRYLRTVRGMAQLLSARGARDDWQEVLDICNRAVQVEPLQEELYGFIFDAMRHLEMKKAVLNYYPVVSRLFYDELGVQLSAPMREIYRWAAEYSARPRADLREVQQDLAETSPDRTGITGAYYCEYELFRPLYQTMARGAQRLGGTVLLFLVTLSGKPGQRPTRAQTADGMKQLGAVIRTALRRGDTYSQYSANQYVLMLLMRTAEDSAVVEKRIAHAFSREKAAAHLSVQLTAQPINAIR